VKFGRKKASHIAVWWISASLACSDTWVCYYGIRILNIASKLILIPQDTRKHCTSHLIKLDHEMNDILKLKLNDHEKWTKYNQTLQRYLHLTEEKWQPIKLLFESNLDGMEESVVSTVPPSLAIKARGFYRLLRKSSNISWHCERQRCTHQRFKHHQFAQRHSPTKEQHQSQRLEEFAKCLRNLNVPREFVGNKKRWDYMQGDQVGGKWH
jgi:hypothetical protein